jgi:transporter family-2 protein
VSTRSTREPIPAAIAHPIAPQHRVAPRASVAAGLAMALVGGALLPAQFATNGALAGTLGSTTLTGAVSYLVGSVFLAALVVLRGQRPDWATARGAPWWAWMGGVVGSAYVVGSVLLTRALGAAVATTLVIAAQVVTAVALEHFGVLGLPRRRLNRARVAALLLTAAALLVRLQGAQ